LNVFSLIFALPDLINEVILDREYSENISAIAISSLSPSIRFGIII
jgi:hypothetical protein